MQFDIRDSVILAKKHTKANVRYIAHYSAHSLKSETSNHARCKQVRFSDKEMILEFCSESDQDVCFLSQAICFLLGFW